MQLATQTIKKIAEITEDKTMYDAREKEASKLLSILMLGKALLAKLKEPIMKLHRRQLSHFSSAEIAESNRLLVKARMAICQGLYDFSCGGAACRGGDAQGLLAISFRRRVRTWPCPKR